MTGKNQKNKISPLSPLIKKLVFSSILLILPYSTFAMDWLWSNAITNLLGEVDGQSQLEIATNTNLYALKLTFLEPEMWEIVLWCDNRPFGIKDDYLNYFKLDCASIKLNNPNETSVPYSAFVSTLEMPIILVQNEGKFFFLSRIWDYGTLFLSFLILLIILFSISKGMVEFLFDKVVRLKRKEKSFPS